MAKCPECHHSFRVPEGDSPEEHGCPACGYSVEGYEYVDDPTIVKTAFGWVKVRDNEVT